ncbi:MAG: aminotransferase class V-fold PLP-dependent enzyme [Phycisphaeraceae bacterium]|nr:aminotransferase class V-fold PLP-dependent enzyme [Phycisphaeraceae bacterium]MCW5763130.1 aminotransferase class V-fold PLP-dependent enzyme [Phycisphaeraceae bacterium]
MSLPMGSPLARHWMLGPDVVFLNNGSFGACPRAVMAARAAVLERSEREPIEFLVNDYWAMMDRSREALGRVVKTAAENIVFLPNATHAVTTILANLRLEAGDELIVNAQEYSACVANFERAAERAGARLVYAQIPFPALDEEEIVEAVVSAASERTRLCLLSHVTSPTAIVMPVAKIVKQLRERGIETLVDGAHAPGYCEVDIDGLGAAYYTANCHKWLCSPRGSAFLAVRKELQATFRPLVLSVFTRKPRTDRSFYNLEFDYVGTQDYSPAICIADAIEHVPSLIDGTWEDVRARNRALALEARDLLCGRLGVEPPVADGMIGSMATIELPEHDEVRQRALLARPTRYHDALQDRLVGVHRVQVPVMSLAGVDGARAKRAFRISCQLYNSLEQYAYLADALVEELRREREMGI